MARAQGPSDSLSGQSWTSISWGLGELSWSGGNVGCGDTWTLGVKQGSVRERPFPKAQYPAPQATDPCISGEPLCPQGLLPSPLIGTVTLGAGGQLSRSGATGKGPRWPQAGQAKLGSWLLCSEAP